RPVGRVGVSPKQGAGGAADQTVSGEQLAQLRDVDVERLRAARRLPLPPESVEQPLHRDDPVRVQKQEREQRALLGAAEREPALAVVDLEWPEDPELHAAATDANSAPKTRHGLSLERAFTHRLHRLKRCAVPLLSPARDLQSRRRTT